MRQTGAMSHPEGLLERRRLPLATGALGLIALLTGPWAGAASTFVDDTGQSVSLAAPARRIVSLAPSATEMLFAAGAGSQVIATTEFADEPPAARRIPRLGDSAAVDLERVLVLRPDVIVLWPAGTGEAQVQRIATLHLPIYRQQVHALADLPGSVRRLGELAGYATRCGARRACARGTPGTAARALCAAPSGDGTAAGVEPPRLHHRRNAAHVRCARGVRGP